MGNCEEIKGTVAFATELLAELKKQCHRWFISFMVCLILLFCSNMAWLYYWNQYEYVDETITQDGSGVNNYQSYIGGDIQNGANDKEIKQN